MVGDEKQDAPSEGSRDRIRPIWLSNFTAGSNERRGATDISRDGMVYVRNTDPRNDYFALHAIEPQLERLQGITGPLHVEVLHADAFDAAVGAPDPFTELRESQLVGPGAADVCLVATLSFYERAFASLDPSVAILPETHGPELLAFVRAHCEHEGASLNLEARALSGLAQHTLFVVARQAWDSCQKKLEVFVRTVRALIETGRVLAMLDPRSAEG